MRRGAPRPTPDLCGLPSVRVACDSLVALGDATADGSVLLAKNSDREPATECQRLVQVPRRTHPPGATVRCQYLEIPEVEETARLIGSQPYWLWGFEHGLNEYGVAIGNHTVFTRDPLGPIGLTGMDLVRLGLERGTSARHAVEVVTGLLVAHGQGGSGFVDKEWPYHNSFLIADRASAYLLETSDRRWVWRRVWDVGSASNHVAIGADWDAASPDLVAHAVANGWWQAGSTERFDFARAYRDESLAPPFVSSARLARTCALLAAARGAITPAILMAALRDHYGRAACDPAVADDDPERYAVCMHAAPVGTTTASMVARLAADGSPLVAWASLGSPCVGIFLPCYVEGEVPAALAHGDAVADDDSPWWRFHALLHAVATDFPRHAPRVRAAWDGLEAEIEARRPAVEAEAARSGPAVLTRFMHDNLAAADARLDALLRATD